VALARHPGGVDPAPRRRRGDLCRHSGWAFALHAGPQVFATYTSVLASAPGLVVLFLITLALLFHLANGVRHLVWDVGFGFAPKTADATAWGAFAFALVANAGLWLALAASGKL